MDVYRERELASKRALSAAVDELTRTDGRIIEIGLGPLELDDITGIITETFHAKEADIREISEALYFRSKGNPLLLQQNLSLLHDKEIIYYDTNDNAADEKRMPGKWKWQINQLSNIDAADDAESFVQQHIKNLEPPYEKLVQCASIIGYSFDAEMLAHIAEMSVKEVIKLLEELTSDGFFVFNRRRYEFVHDKLREAVYRLIDKDERAKLHLEAARLALHSESQEIEEKLFEIADHFSLA